MILLLVGSSHVQLDVLRTSSLHNFGIFQQPARHNLCPKNLCQERGSPQAVGNN
jgi:hypothetical protein